VARAARTGESAGAGPYLCHNSDPDLVYRPDVDELYLFYTVQQRSVRCSSYNRNELRLIRSHDGVRWSAAETVLSWDLAKAPLYLSPGVVYRDGSFELWMAGNGGVVHATSRDGFVWSPVAPVRIDAKPWHLDVEFDEARSAYWMVYVDSPRPGSKLRLATSSDGLSWAVYPAPLLVPGRAWDDNRIYRATFVEGSGTFRVWYSAESRLGQWHIGYAEAASVALSP